MNSSELVSDADGEYYVVDLEPGRYVIEAHIPGFGLHEVERLVPESKDETKSDFAHLNWEWIGKEVHLPTIEIIEDSKLPANLVKITGGTFLSDIKVNAYTLPAETEILDFEIQQEEVTIGDFILSGLDLGETDVFQKTNPNVYCRWQQVIIQLVLKK